MNINALPRHIVLIRHAQTAGLERLQADLRVPNHRVPISAEGVQQAVAAGQWLRGLLLGGSNAHPDGSSSSSLHGTSSSNAVSSASSSSSSSNGSSGSSGIRQGGSCGDASGAPRSLNGSGSSGDGGSVNGATCSGGQRGPPLVHILTSPYLRCIQTAQHLATGLGPELVAGAQEEVQLREQDVGNFPGAEWHNHAAERLEYSRFFFRWPSGESAADVYDRLTMLQDHLVRDMAAGRFGSTSSLVLVTHGLTLRLFLMRWLRWSVDQFMHVHNAPEATPIVLTRTPAAPPPWTPNSGGSISASGNSTSDSGGCASSSAAGASFAHIGLGRASFETGPALTPNHIKGLYRLTPASQGALEGVSDAMCCHLGALSASALAQLRPYRQRVPPVPGCEAVEAVLQALMAKGYGDVGA